MYLGIPLLTVTIFLNVIALPNSMQMNVNNVYWLTTCPYFIYYPLFSKGLEYNTY